MTLPTIGLFYGSSTCYTEIAAEKIQEQLKEQAIVELHNVASCDIALMKRYHYLILGIPTWDYGELQEDWENQWPALSDIDFQGKKIALYGLGDQIGYPEWFQDALGYLYQKVVEQGGQVIGFWPTEDYQYTSSLAVVDQNNTCQPFFVGLALDDESEFEKSDQRIQHWCQQIITEFTL
ncbi:MAG: flavodoxin FldB [Cellvibrionaceae bacterium]